MHYAEKHFRIARILAERPEGVTAIELAKRTGISKRLAQVVLRDLVEKERFVFRPRPNKERGPDPWAARRAS